MLLQVNICWTQMYYQPIKSIQIIKYNYFDTFSNSNSTKTIECLKKVDFRPLITTFVL